MQCHSDLPTANQMYPRAVMRPAEQLELHPVVKDLGSIVLDEFNLAAQQAGTTILEPILITSGGTILAGFGQWRLAILKGDQIVNCIEYPITEEESLQFVLRYHLPKRTWNAFVRICMALTRERYFQQKALENMRAAGKYKGLANLPEAERIDVRRAIAVLAGVGPRNVSKAKTILQAGHSRLIHGLQDGTLTINRAMQWCKLPKAEQLEQFVLYSSDRETSKVIRQAVTRPKEDKTCPDVFSVLNALQQQETQEPGSVEVRVGLPNRTIVLISQDQLTGPLAQARSLLK
jgi:hypothetical protein